MRLELGVDLEADHHLPSLGQRHDAIAPFEHARRGEELRLAATGSEQLHADGQVAFSAAEGHRDRRRHPRGWSES